MSFLSAIRVALAALLINKGRSALTSLGIVIGISAVIAMVSAGAGAEHKLDGYLDNFGKTMILLRPGGRTQQGALADFTPLTRDDAAAIRKQLGPLLSGVAECQFTQRVATSRNGHWPTAIVGTTPEIIPVRHWKIERGRFFTDDEIRHQAPVCLIGLTVQRKLFPDPKEDPIGRTIRVGHVQLRIIGILGEKGRALTGADQDDQIFVPITTVSRKIVGDEKITMILIGAKTEADVDKVKDKVEALMRQRHRIKPGTNPDFDIS
ncbi:MAG: ABC transporter permease, partial [Gemmataceae bacterium]|nr:ABC transporter permease [Gemmataceae bacterium]